MTTSSAQDIYSITLTDDQISALTTVDLSTLTTTSISSINTYSYTNGSSSYYINTAAGTNGTYSTTSGTISMPTISINDLSVFTNDEWVNSFPSWGRIQKMCDEYPGLKIAFEKFKTTYNLVKDDYDAPPNKKIRP